MYRNFKGHLRVRSRRGAAMAELSIVIPILMLLVGGILDYSLVFFVSPMVQHAAYKAARYGAVTPGAGEAQIGRASCRERV